ncbi:MAG: thiamine pyrophosphate-binding protein [Acetobacteraceae bacterium]
MTVMTGSRVFLELLKAEGVEVLFGNPGTTELPLMDALATETGLRYVLALQESVAMAMADGYARASGRLGAVNLHVAPGLGNAMGMLFDAQRAGSPVLVTAGQQAQGFGVTEPNLYAELPPIAQPFVKWSAEVRSIAEMPLMVHRAAKIALSPPTGPVFLSLPNDVMAGEAEVDLGAPTRVATRLRADPAAIAQAVAALAAAKRPVIIAGDAVSQSDAHAELVALAELLGAPVYLEGEASTNGFPTRHPLCRFHLARSGAVIRRVLDGHDLLFSVGADLFTLSLPPEVQPVPPGLRIIHLDNDPWQLGKNYPADPALLGDAKATLPEITAGLAAALSDAQRRLAQQRGDAAREENARIRSGLLARAQAGAAITPVPVVTAMHAIGELVPKDAIIVDETISSGEGLREFLQCDDPAGFHGMRGGGIGWGLPGAVGVQLARPDRQVVALVGDGSAMYTIQALWTAANARVPVIFVILNNRSYRILKQRLNGVRGLAEQTGNYVGMDLTDPPIDYVGLARSMGLEAVHAPDLPAFRAALRDALTRRRPVLIELAIERRFKPA